jgi:hypothetical protein
MPQTKRAAYLREKATNFRRLAGEHDEAGNRPISDKLIEVAVDFEGQADELVIAAAVEDLRRRIEAIGHGVTDLEALAASAAAAARLACNRPEKNMTKLLVIDAAALVRTTLEYLLSAAGYEIATAEDSARGMAMFGGGQPDLVKGPRLIGPRGS